MADPIVFAKCDGRPGNEALILIYAPDRSTTKDQQQITIRARSLDQEALSEIGLFIEAARPIVEQIGREMRDKPIGLLQVSDDPPGAAAVW